MKRILRLANEQSGATAVEYAVMLTLVILVCFSAVLLLGQRTSTSYSNSAQSINAVTGS
jgi:pilus assembly protein Flp/PilA